jgi:hypothetical protein
MLHVAKVQVYILIVPPSLHPMLLVKHKVVPFFVTSRNAMILLLIIEN